MTTPQHRPWPRWRLAATLAGIATTALALLAGLVLAITSALTTPTGAPDAASPRPQPGVQGEAYRDQVATAPMLAVPAAAASTPQVATRLAPTIDVPPATGDGPAGVAAGFPHTPEGAVGQLAAIEVRVVEAMSIPTAHDVHAAWTMPGGVTASEWAMTRNVQAFLTTLGDQGNARDDTILVSAHPAAGLVKGTDGPDWVVACVLLDVRASIVADARIAYGHCERMHWHQGRWQIGPGSPPAPAPSTWPGSDLAVDAGWRPWTVGEGSHG